MDFIVRHKMILLGIVLVVVGFFLYSSFSQAPGDILNTESGDLASNPGDKTFVETLLILHSVSLSGTIFSDPSFLRLKDFSTPITEETVGRTDPFAPLPAPTASQIPASSQGAQLFKAGRP